MLVIYRFTPDLKNSKSILNIINSKDNCLQLTITAWLHPAMDQETRENQYQNELFVPRQQHEDDLTYILRIQKIVQYQYLVIHTLW